MLFVTFNDEDFFQLIARMQITIRLKVPYYNITGR